jgi:hypothetical protein
MILVLTNIVQPKNIDVLQNVVAHIEAAADHDAMSPFARIVTKTTIQDLDQGVVDTLHITQDQSPLHPKVCGLHITLIKIKLTPATAIAEINIRDLSMVNVRFHLLDVINLLGKIILRDLLYVRDIWYFDRDPGERHPK